MVNELPPILQDDNILYKLEDIFKEHFKNPSYNIAPNISWKEKVINFDKVKETYTKNNNFELKSNDALYISKNNTHYFIEFKNGNYRNFRKIDLISKIYDSLFILSDIKYEDGSQYIKNIVDFSKNYIYYILVYNSANNSNRQNYNLRFYIKSNLGLKKFKKFLLKEIYIYNEKEFEKALKTKFEIIK